MKVINIEATTISDAWFQSIFACIEEGRQFTIDHGSYAGQLRLEFDYITVHIKMPWVEPLEPQIPTQYNIPNPVPDGYIADYLPYLMTDKISDGEAYTYGQRLTGFEISYSMSQLCDKNIFIGEPYINKSVLNQIDLLIWMYKNKGHRNNQMCLQIASPDDMLLKDPPCLRLIDSRIQDNKLHFFPYFRCINAQEKALYNIQGIIYYDTLKKIHSEVQIGKDVFILSADLNKGEAVWGKIIDSSLRKESKINNYKVKSEFPIGLTDEHWVFTEDLTVKQAKQLKIKDKLIRLIKIDNLSYAENNCLDIFDIFQDNPKYYIRNLSLKDIKLLCDNPKSSWRDKRVLPVSVIYDINDIPKSATIGIARSKIERSRYLELTESLGYLFGAWLANGWFKENNLLIAIGKYRSTLMGKLLRHLDIAEIKYTTYDQDSVDICHIGDTMLKGIMESLYFKSGSLFKDVPSFVFRSPFDFKKGLFQGWYDGDSGCTSSKNLAEQMRVISSLVGIATSLYIEEPRIVYLSMDDRFITSSRSYRVSIIEGSRCSINNNIYKKCLTEIIESSDKEVEVVDFTVEEHGNFCVGCGSIIVHNSWDLWSGFPANLAGIELMKQYIASEIGVENGEIIASSKGLHLYDYVFELAEILRGRK